MTSDTFAKSRSCTAWLIVFLQGIVILLASQWSYSNCSYAHGPVWNLWLIPMKVAWGKLCLPYTVCALEEKEDISPDDQVYAALNSTWTLLYTQECPVFGHWDTMTTLLSTKFTLENSAIKLQKERKEERKRKDKAAEIVLVLNKFTIFVGLYP